MGPRLASSVVGCLVVLGTAGCTGGQAPAGSPSPSPSHAPALSPGVPTTTTRANVVATRGFSAWLLHAVPMPRGSREWSHSPTSHFRQGSVGIGPSDAHFTRTTWWTVPLSRGPFGSWLRAHAPHVLRAEPDSGGPVESRGVWEQDRDFRAPSTTAHTAGWVNFAFVPWGDGLVVRVDTFVGARFARTVLVPQDTTSVTIRRTERSTAPHSRPHTSVRTVDDPGAVADLVAMVNGLTGAMTTQFVASCLAIVTEQSYSMSFASPQGEFAASLPSTTCWPRLTLLHDGAGAGPSLDPGRAFTRTADRYLPVSRAGRRT